MTDQTLSIPAPRATRNVYRGFGSIIAPPSKPVSIRWTEHDHEFISKQAHKYGVTFSEFVRWCTYHAAMDAHRQDTAVGRKAAAAAGVRAKVDINEYEDKTQ